MIALFWIVWGIGAVLGGLVCAVWWGMQPAKEKPDVDPFLIFGPPMWPLAILIAVTGFIVYGFYRGPIRGAVRLGEKLRDRRVRKKEVQEQAKEAVRVIVNQGPHRSTSTCSNCGAHLSN